MYESIYPPGFRNYLVRAFESEAYYGGYPYPAYALRSWKTEELGPYPTPLPIMKSIVDRSAIWLFGKQTNFTFPQLTTEVDKAIVSIWKKNKLDSRLVSMARMGGIEGGVGLKFTYDKEKDKVIIQTLSCKDHVQFFYDPHDSTRLMMVRVEYIYFDMQVNKWMIFREEIEDKEYRRYIPQQASSINKSFLEIKIEQLNTSKTWEIDTANSGKNEYGIINVVHIKNIDDGTHFGAGDLFGLFRIIDRINVTYNLMDRNNQLHVDPALLLIDLEPKEGNTTPQGMQPGAILDVQTAVGVVDDDIEDKKITKQGKAQLLEPVGLIREHLLNYAKELTQMLFDATGAVFPRQEQITNKGALTQSVIIQIYAQLLEITEEKRKSYGTEGISKFLQTMIIGLKNCGMKEFKSITAKDITDDDLTCNFTWFSHFKQTQDDLFAQFDRIDREVKGGYITEETAIRTIANFEELPLTDEELAKQVLIVQKTIKEQNEPKEPIQRDRGNDPKSKQQIKGNRVNDAE